MRTAARKRASEMMDKEQDNRDEQQSRHMKKPRTRAGDKSSPDNLQDDTNEDAEMEDDAPWKTARKSHLSSLLEPLTIHCA